MSLPVTLSAIDEDVLTLSKLYSSMGNSELIFTGDLSSNLSQCKIKSLDFKLPTNGRHLCIEQEYY